MTRPTREARRERSRVVLLFAASILPPLVLLAILAWIAAKNDEAAYRQVAEEHARQTSANVKTSLEAAVREAEGDVFASLDPALFRRRDPAGRRELAAGLAELQARPGSIASRFMCVTTGGEVLWPEPLPFLVQGHDRDPDPAPPDEAPGASVEHYRQRAELLARYDAAALRAQGAPLPEVAAELSAIAADAAATPTLAARAAFRLGHVLERLARHDDARAAYARAAGARLPVRDESGKALRVHAALRTAELDLVAGRTEAARGAAAAQGEALLAGKHREELDEAEWRASLERVRAVLEAGAPDPQAAARARALHEGTLLVLARLEWLLVVYDSLPQLLAEAPDLVGGDVRRMVRLDDGPGVGPGGAPAPRVIAYRVLPGLPGQPRGREAGPRVEPLVVGFQLDLPRLGAAVLRPACERLTLDQGAAVAIIDGRGATLASAGADATPEHGPAPAGGGAATAATPGATVPLDVVPTWSVRVFQPAAELERARRNRVLMYGSLIALTTLAALAGAIATHRYVNHSLELAKMKSDFLSNITHELKTPLTSIKMYGELLASGRVRSDDKRRDYSEHIVREGERLQKLIDEILDFARQDAGQKQFVLAEEDVADTVAEALDLFRHSARAQGFDLYVELPPIGALPPVDLDREAIVRAVMNLLTNAVKYSGDSRWIRLSVLREGHAMIAVAVEDKGIGIDEEDLPRIFDRFYRAGDVLTRGVSGTGLGLALVDQIVQAHDGKVRVESEKGVGSIFTILLPIVPDYREQWPPPELPPGTESEPEPDPEAEELAGEELAAEELEGEEPAGEEPAGEGPVVPAGEEPPPHPSAAAGPASAPAPEGGPAA